MKKIASNQITEIFKKTQIEAQNNQILAEKKQTFDKTFFSRCQNVGKL